MSGPPTLPTVLVTEILGFAPQLLLDDVINIANEAVTLAVDGMEEFLLNEVANGKIKGDRDQEIEQGLVAFQTLLESHIDIAFDFFELWSLRNIFAIPANLPVVTPHHQGLNLKYEPERELELMTEIEDLRRKIQTVRSPSASHTNSKSEIRSLTLAAPTKTNVHPRRSKICQHTPPLPISSLPYHLPQLTPT